MVLLTKYCEGDKIEKNGMGRACSMYRGDMFTGFWWRDLRKRGHLEDPDVDGRII